MQMFPRNQQEVKVAMSYSKEKAYCYNPRTAEIPLGTQSNVSQNISEVCYPYLTQKRADKHFNRSHHYDSGDLVRTGKDTA